MDASRNAEANAHHVHYIICIDCNNLIPVSVPLHEGTYLHNGNVQIDHLKKFSQTFHLQHVCHLSACARTLYVFKAVHVAMSLLHYLKSAAFGLL